MKKTILLVCAAIYVGVLLAAAHIYSPNFGAFVKTGPGITLDASVSSTNTPGSCDFAATNHPYLKRPEATAFYSLFDNYYAHQVRTSAEYDYRTFDPSPYNTPVRDYAFLTVTTNALFNYPALMTNAYNLVNMTSDFEYNKPFYKDDRSTSSSFFSNFVDNWDTDGFVPSIDLSNWPMLAVITDLDNDDVFHYRHARKTPAHDYYPLLRVLFGDVDHYLWSGNIHFNEYEHGGTTVPDYIYQFDHTPSLYDEPLTVTFKEMADMTWPDNDIYQITNRSLAISWKPLCAISQTLALMDSVINVGDYGSSIWNGLVHNYARQDHAYRDARADDCGKVRINFSGGTSSVISAPTSDPSSISLDYVYHNLKTYEPSRIFYALRVGETTHRANVSGSTGLTSSNTFSLPIRFILDACGFTERNTNCVLEVLQDPYISGSYYNCDLSARVNEGDWHTLPGASLYIGDIEGEHDVTLVGSVHASYDIFQDHPFSQYFNPGAYPEHKACVDTVREFAIMSYAVTTNAPPGHYEWGEYYWFDPINFGYEPPAAKPSVADASMKYGYWRRSFETNAVSYGATKYNFDLEGLAAAKGQIHEDVMARVGGDYTDTETYLGLSEGTARAELSDFHFDSIDTSIPVPTSSTNIVHIAADGSTTPDAFVITPTVMIHVSYASPHGEFRRIHPSCGADVKQRAAQKYKMKYPSLRTY